MPKEQNGNSTPPSEGQASQDGEPQSPDTTTLPPIDILVEYEGWENSLPNAQEFVTSRIAAVLAEFEPPFGSIDVLLCDDARIHELNREWRGHDKPTNVLSFEDIDDNVLGNIAIAHDYCAREAIEQNKSFADHISHMVVHGTLHILGFDHIEDDEAEEMEALEIEILAKLGINTPYETIDDLNGGIERDNYVGK